MLLQKKTRHTIKFTNRVTLTVGTIFGLLSIIGNYSIGRALEWSNTGITVIILRIQIIFVIIMGFIFLKEKLHYMFFIGVAISLLGLLTFNIETIGIPVHSHTVYWGIFAASCFAIANIIIKKNIKDINILGINLLRLLVGVIGIPLFMEEFQILELPYIGLAFLAGLFGPNLSRLVQMYVMKELPVSHVISFTMITPVATIILSWLLFDDVPSLAHLCGGTLILFGITLTTLRPAT